jgi:inorganic pyrophosphatase
MVTSVNELPAVDPDSGRLNVVVDTPKGSRIKYKFDERQGLWRLSKVLPQGLSFPYDFGFVPSTRGGDGDPLDVLVLMDEPAFPGCVVPARLIGVLEAEQTEGGKTVRNDRLVAVVETPYNPAEFRSLEDVNRQRLDEIEDFFVSYNQAEGRQFKPLARRGADHARELVEKATGAPRRGAMAPVALGAGARNEGAGGGPGGTAGRTRGRTMSFELRPDESLRKGIRRIVRKQLDEALEHLTGPHKGPRDEAVHEARKCFKKVRAVLRLVRPVIGEKSYRAENACFRDAGRPLTEVRDAKIFVEALDRLAEHFQEYVVGRSFADVRRALQGNLRAVRKRVLDEQDAFAVVAEEVRQARGRVKGWADMPNKWAAVGGGLEEVHRRAGDARGDAAADPTVERLHEWRKQAKYLRYQLEVLRPLWPERMEELADEADRMGEVLGDDHDLAALRQMLNDVPGRYGGEGDREVLLALIDRRRAELQAEALLLGRRFFQDGARGFARRLRGYWKTWRTRRGRLTASG